MFNMKALFLRALLALAIAAGAPAALAGPTYKVTLDTSALAGSTGYLDLGLNGPGDAVGAARIGNFSGNFVGTTPQLFGDASGDVVNGAILGNDFGFNFFDQLVEFGGIVSFDVRFDALGGPSGLLFSVAFMDETLTSYLGAAGNLLEISLMPGEPDVVDRLVDGVQLSAVPEPADWLLLATGLLLIGVTRRLQPGR